MKIRDIKEGWETLPPINRDRYQERPGLEGPFQTRVGKVIYYDPKEGAYYDPDSDMYLSYEEWQALDDTGPFGEVEVESAQARPPRTKKRMVTKNLGTLAMDESLDDYVQVGRSEFNDVARGPGAQLNGSTGGLYIDNTLVGYRDNGTFFLDPEYTDVEMTENRLKPNASARAYTDQMDRSHAMQRAYDAPQKAPAKLMKAIRDAEHERRATKKTEGFRSGGKYHSGGTSYYLINPRTAGRVERDSWALMSYEDSPGNNPRYLRKMLDEYAKSLGWDDYDVFTQWNGEIDDKIGAAQEQEAEYENKKDEFPAQYWESKQTAEKLKAAKEIMADGEEAQPAMEEARDPMGVINKFLSKKEAGTRRSADLAKNPHKVKQLKSDEQLDEYKPGVTVLNRSISFNDFEGHKGDEDYATVKKIRWPYGVDVRFNDRTKEVTFKTAKMKTVAKILDKYIDFDSNTAADILDLPGPLLMSSATNEAGVKAKRVRPVKVQVADNGAIYVDDTRITNRSTKPFGWIRFKAEFKKVKKAKVVELLFANGFESEAMKIDSGDYRQQLEDYLAQKNGDLEEAEVGDRVKYRNIKSKRNKTGTVRKVDDKNGQKRYELDGGKMVYDGDLEEQSGEELWSAIGIDQYGNEYKLFADPDRAKLDDYIKRMMNQQRVQGHDHPLFKGMVDAYSERYDEARPKFIPNGDPSLPWQQATNEGCKEKDYKRSRREATNEAGGKLQSQPAKAGDGSTGTMYHYGDPNKLRWTIWADGTVMVHKDLKGYEAQGAEKAKLVKLAQGLKEGGSYRDSGYKRMAAASRKADKEADKVRAQAAKKKTTNEAMPDMGKTIIIAYKGEKVGEFSVPANARVHHIDQKLRELSGRIRLGDFERTQVARELSKGKVAKAGGFGFQVVGKQPREMQ